MDGSGVAVSGWTRRIPPDRPVDWAGVAAAAPGVAAFTQVSGADPAGLSPAQTLDVIVTADRLISHLHAVQAAAVARFARPGGAGNGQDLIDAVTQKGGFAQRPDGTMDPQIVACLREEHAHAMAAAEIGAALRQARVGAGRRVAAAVELVEELPATLAALRAGRIDLPRARTIAERTRDLPPPGRRRVEAAVLPLAETRTPGQLTPMIDRRVLAVDADAVRKRCARARRDRFVDHTPGVDGMGTIRAQLPAEGAVSVFDLLDRIAQATAGQDDRPVAARRADALVDICVHLLVDGRVDLAHPNCAETTNTDTDTDTDIKTTDLPGIGAGPGVADADFHADVADPAGHADADADRTGVVIADAGTVVAGGAAGAAPRPGGRVSAVQTRHGRGAHFNLTMSVAAFTAATEDPAELAGHGMIPAELARGLRQSMKSLAVVLTNAAGQPVAVGGTVYVPRQVVTDQALTAAGTCRFPACRIPAARCDLDHRVPFDHEHPERGGGTDPTNLDPLCRRHHLLKTFTDWSAVRSPDDGVSMLWTSPTGHHHVHHGRECALPDTDTTPPRMPPTEIDGHCGGRPERVHPGGHADGGNPDGGVDPAQVCTDPAHPCTDPAHACAGCGRPCTEAAGHEPRELAAVPLPPPTQAEQARQLIKEQNRREEEQTEQARRRAAARLGKDPVLTYRLGFTPDPPNPNPNDDPDDPDDDEFDILDYPDYQPPTEAFMKRFLPLQHAQQQTAKTATTQPDPTTPPF